MRWTLTILLILCAFTGWSQIPSLQKPHIPPVNTWADSAKISGTLNASMGFYGLTNSAFNRRDPFYLKVYGAPVVQLGEVVVPVYLQLGDYQSRYRQTFNKWGLSPQYKWVKVHLGHRNYYYNKYVFNGHNLFGGGVELNPGKYRLAVVYGRLLEAITPDTAANQFYRPTYARKGLAVKAGYGGPANYVDVTFFKASDNPGSIQDTQFLSPLLNPQQNTSLGITTQQRIRENYHLSIDLGLSAYTTDIETQEAATRDVTVAKILSPFVRERVSTQYATAWSGSFEYRKRAFMAGLDFERVAPDYQSMGIYFIRDDLQRIRLKSRFLLLDNKISLSPFLGLEQNNILNTSFIKNNRFILSLNGVYRATDNLTLHFNVGNYGTRVVQLQEIEDSILIRQVTRTAAVGGTYHLGGERKQMVFANIAYHSGRNIGEDSTNRYLSSLQISGGYKTFIPAADLSLTPVLRISKYNLPFFNTTRISPGIRAGKPFLEDRLHGNYTLALIFASVNGMAATTVFQNTIDVTYQLSDSHDLAFMLQHHYNNWSGPGAGAFNEFQGNVTYVWRFSRR